MNEWVFIAAAAATGLATLGAGFAVARVGVAAVGALAEKPELFGRLLIFIGLAEGIAIYGLIEARMSRADLVICGGLVEGTWPGTSAPDAMLAPAVLRALGVPVAACRPAALLREASAALAPLVLVLPDIDGSVPPPDLAERLRQQLGLAA